MGIFVEKGHSLGSETRGVRLLGGCVYYAEYGNRNSFTKYFLYIEVSTPANDSQTCN